MTTKDEVLALADAWASGRYGDQGLLRLRAERTALTLREIQARLDWLTDEVQKQGPLALRCMMLQHQLAQPVHINVTDLRNGEDNEGPLVGKDLFVSGRGVHLLVHLDIQGDTTYSLSVDGSHQQSGYIAMSEVTYGQKLAVAGRMITDMEEQIQRVLRQTYAPNIDEAIKYIQTLRARIRELCPD